MKYKKAFTLVEILFIMILTSVVAVMAMGVMKHLQANYKDIYYATYKNIQHAIGESIAASSTKTITDNTAACTQLANSFNTVGSTTADCTYRYNISVAKGLSGTILPDLNKPSFTLTNGTRFYVGNIFDRTVDNYFYTSAFIIAVDLNGKAGPNIFDTRTYTGSKTPDVVAFAVLTDGNVVPMSPMADRDDYLIASVQRCSKATGCPISTATDIITGYDRIAIRKALSVSNNFPGRATDSAYSPYQYNTDNIYAFKTAYTVDPICDPSNANYFCKLILFNPILSGVGAGL